jgi:hypothetical protein
MKTIRNISGILFFNFLFLGLLGINATVSANTESASTNPGIKTLTITDAMISNPTYWIDYLSNNTQGIDQDENQITFTDEMISTPAYWPSQINKTIVNDENPVVQMENDPYYWVHFINQSSDSI